MKWLNPYPTIYKNDKGELGLIIGLICPLLGFPLSILFSMINHAINNDPIITTDIIAKTITNFSIVVKYLSIGCIMNLAVFYYYMNRDRFNTARGIIVATFLMCLPVLVDKISSIFR